MGNLIGLEEARARLTRIGKTTVDVAKELHVPVGIVRGVLQGRFKGTRGDAHKVAVALGLKDGIVVGDGTPFVDAYRAAAQ